MAEFATTKRLAEVQKRFFDDFKNDRIKLHAEMVGQFKGDARKEVSGRISTKRLRQMGHPFGAGGDREAGYQLKRIPKTQVGTAGAQFRRVSTGTRVTSKGSAPLLPINKQTGNLLRSQKVKRVDDSRYTHEFTRKYAKYVLSPTGTRNKKTKKQIMVPRGWYAQMDKHIKKRSREFLTLVNRAALNYR